MSIDPDEKNWRQYHTHIDLYKFYVDMVIKINAFHFAISGAIFSFYFANSTVPDLRWALSLPALMSIALFLLFVYGAFANLISRTDVFKLRDKMGLEVAPELLMLTIFLFIFAIVNLLTFLGTLYVLFCFGT